MSDQIVSHSPARAADLPILQRHMRYVDLFEKVTLVIIFLFMLDRILKNYYATGAIFNLLYIVDQAVVLAFIIFRRPAKEVSVRGFDWFVGFAGTFLPLLVVPVAHPGGLVGHGTATMIMLAGFVIHFAAKLSLRRSMGVVAANRGVRESGTYRLVRHPMYAGYIVGQTGLLLGWPDPWNATVIVLTWTLLVLRIMAEERMLMQDPAYRQLTQNVRYRLIPGVW